MIDTTPPKSSLTFPLRLLRRVMPAAMLVVLLGGMVGGARLALALGQPFPGVALMWRREFDHYIVGWLTPPHWPGLGAGRLQVNDHILCIDGYYSDPSARAYGRESRHADSLCPQGEKDFFELFRERYDSAEPARLEFWLDRGGETETVPDIPLVRFTPIMLAETLLPTLLVGLGFLAVGFVVYRANPATEINLTFALFTTIIAGMMMDQSSPHFFSAWPKDMLPVTLILTIPWAPLLGAVFFHLISLLTDQAPLLSLAHRLRRPYYALSFLCSFLAIWAFVMEDLPIRIALMGLFVGFGAASCLFAAIWGGIALAWTWRKTSSRRIRRQTGLILVGLTVSMGFLVPFMAFFFGAPTSRYLHSTPYLTLALVAVIAYAILRYQLFASKANILTTLLVTIWCILTANLMYLIASPTTGFLPILAATLITAAGLMTRRGPTAFFNRLLRRESLDYRTVARFSQRVGGLQQIESLLLVAQRSLQDNLDIEQVDVWLLDSERQALEQFCEGEFVRSIPLPPDFAARLSARPTPLHTVSPLAADYRALLRDESGQVALWVPLVDRGQAVGLLALGPRWTGEVYDEQDLQLIGILARQMALAILNTRHIERLRAMSRLIVQAEENERRKIARELHDTILQFLLVLTYGLDDLSGQQKDIAAEIERWQDRISVEAEQLRDMLSYLRAPEVLVQQGLIPSLQSWIERVRQDTTMPIETDFAPEAEQVLSVEAQVALYRVFRETIRNAVKHSMGHYVKAWLRVDGESVRFSIQDDGRGFDVKQALESDGKGYSSLQDMRIYVENVGGRLDICAIPGEGTVIQGQVPVTVTKRTDGETENG